MKTKRIYSLIIDLINSILSENEKLWIRSRGLCPYIWHYILFFFTGRDFKKKTIAL